MSSYSWRIHSLLTRATWSFQVCTSKVEWTNKVLLYYSMGTWSCSPPFDTPFLTLRLSVFGFMHSYSNVIFSSLSEEHTASHNSEHQGPSLVSSVLKLQDICRMGPKVTPQVQKVLPACKLASAIIINNFIVILYSPTIFTSSWVKPYNHFTLAGA